MRILIAYLLTACLIVTGSIIGGTVASRLAPLHSAQVITIPEGTSAYGPWAMNQLHRISQVSIERTSNAFTNLTVTFEYSPDKQNTWIWYGTTVFPGGGPLTARLGSLKQLPTGVTATHIRIIVNLVGGSMTVKQIPTVVTK
jgi:hypothetical protein